MRKALRWCWPPALGLAAGLILTCGVSAENVPLSQRIELCGSCHGADGNSRMNKIPSLAGQPQLFVFNQLFLMREGVRRVEAMAAIVKELSDAELEALAKHFSSLPPKSTDQSDDSAATSRGADLAARLRCGSCHLATLAGQAQTPRLSKQRVDYLVHALTQFRDGTRSGGDSIMSSTLGGLSDADLTALAVYAGSR
jgi:cytochrome c553